MPVLNVYSRQGCHLCELLIEELLPLVRGRMDVEVHDVDDREEWRRAYDIRIPVVEFEGDCISEHTLDRAALQHILAGLTDSGHR
jgi:hypothetical protein